MPVHHAAANFISAYDHGHSRVNGNLQLIIDMSILIRRRLGGVLTHLIRLNGIDLKDPRESRHSIRIECSPRVHEQCHSTELPQSFPGPESNGLFISERLDVDEAGVPHVLNHSGALRGWSVDKLHGFCRGRGAS